MKRAVVCLLCLLALVATAETVILQPGQQKSYDAFCWELYPDNNYGYNPLLRVATPDHQDQGQHALLQFIDLVYHEGRLVLSALLEVYTVGVEGDGGEVEIGACDYWWAEDAVTWNTFMSIHPHTERSVDYPGGGGDWLTVEVTDIVQEWLDGGLANYGFMIFDEDADDRYLSFNSSDFGTDDTVRPKLTLELSEEAVEPVSWGAIKALE